MEEEITVPEIVKLKNKLETDIAKLITNFCAETDLNVRLVVVDLVDVTAVMSTKRQVVSRVRVEAVVP